MAWSWQTPWKPSWLYVLLERQQVIDYSKPSPPPLEPRLTTWGFVLSPNMSKDNQGEWIEFGRMDPANGWQTMKLESVGRIKHGERLIRQIKVVHNEER